MGLFDDIKAKGAAYRLTEEALYSEVLREMESGVRRDGLWAKALAESAMDTNKAHALYIKYRVQSLKDEAEILLKNIGASREVDYQRTSKQISLPRSRQDKLMGIVFSAIGIIVIIAIGLYLFREFSLARERVEHEAICKNLLSQPRPDCTKHHKDSGARWMCEVTDLPQWDKCQSSGGKSPY